MSKAQQVRDYVRQHPGVTASEVGEAVGIRKGMASTYLGLEVDRRVMRRELLKHTITNVPIYAYWMADASFKSKPAVSEDNVVQIKTTKKTSKDIEQSKSVESILSEFVSGFAKSLAGAIVDQLKPQLEAELRNALPSALPTMPQLPKPPKEPEVIQAKPKLPKVGVTGLLPQQAGMLQSEFCDTFDMVFWNDRNGDGMGSLKAMGSSCEAVFYHVNHSSHTTESALRSVGANIIRVNGGMSQMRDSLTRYYVERAA